MNRFLQVFCAFFSGLILALAIPNEILLFGSPVMGIFALVPLYIAIAHASSYREAFLLTALQAFTVHMLSSFWLANFRDFAVFTLGASALGTAFVAACFGLLLYVPYSTRNMLLENAGKKSAAVSFRILYFALVWTLWEWAKSNGFLGYPWGTVSMTAYSFKPIIQIADIAGAYGITFIFAFFSAVVAEGFLLLDTTIHAVKPAGIIRDYRNTASALCVLAVLAFCYGIYQYYKPRTPVKFLNTVIVQQNLDPWAEENDTASITVSEKLTEEKIREFKDSGVQPDLVLWSEAVLHYAFPYSAGHYSVFPQEEPLLSFIQRMHVPFVIGAPYAFNQQRHLYGNAAVMLDENGTYRGAFCKMHLVPFAEAIPGTEYEWVLKFMDAIVGFSSGWKAGEQYVLFDIPGKINPDVLTPVQIISLDTNAVKKDPVVRISTPICFEDAFPPVCRGLYMAGSEVFMNITDDSWSLTKSAEYQHFVIAALRAVEFRTTLVRSTNSGYSAVVDPSGRIIKDLPLFSTASLAYPVPVYSHSPTIYAQYGDWFVYLAGILVAVYIFLLGTKNTKLQSYC